MRFIRYFHLTNILLVVFITLSGASILLEIVGGGTSVPENSAVTLLCTIVPYGMRMSWLVDNVIYADCLGGLCAQFPNAPETYTYHFNESEGKFELTIPLVNSSHAQKVFACDDGSTRKNISFSITEAITVTNENNEKHGLRCWVIPTIYFPLCLFELLQVSTVVFIHYIVKMDNKREKKASPGYRLVIFFFGCLPGIGLLLCIGLLIWKRKQVSRLKYPVAEAFWICFPVVVIIVCVLRLNRIKSVLNIKWCVIVITGFLLATACQVLVAIHCFVEEVTTVIYLLCGSFYLIPAWMIITVFSVYYLTIVGALKYCDDCKIYYSIRRLKGYCFPCNWYLCEECLKHHNARCIHDERKQVECSEKHCKDDAESLCLECKLYLCKACANKHTKHTLSSCKDGGNKNVRCSSHQCTLDAALSCLECEVDLCELCEKMHTKHSLLSRKDGAFVCRRCLKIGKTIPVACYSIVVDEYVCVDCYGNTAVKSKLNTNCLEDNITSSEKQCQYYAHKDMHDATKHVQQNTKATAYCLICQLYFCKTCFEKHRRPFEISCHSMHRLDKINKPDDATDNVYPDDRSTQNIGQRRVCCSRTENDEEPVMFCLSCGWYMCCLRCFDLHCFIFNGMKHSNEQPNIYKKDGGQQSMETKRLPNDGPKCDICWPSNMFDEWEPVTSVPAACCYCLVCKLHLCKECFTDHLVYDLKRTSTGATDEKTLQWQIDVNKKRLKGAGSQECGLKGCTEIVTFNCLHCKMNICGEHKLVCHQKDNCVDQNCRKCNKEKSVKYCDICKFNGNQTEANYVHLRCNIFFCKICINVYRKLMDSVVDHENSYRIKSKNTFQDKKRDDMIDTAIPIPVCTLLRNVRCCVKSQVEHDKDVDIIDQDEEHEV